MADWIHLAESVAAAANLDDDAHALVKDDLLNGAWAFAVLDAVTNSRIPLPSDLLDQITKDLPKSLDPEDLQRLRDAIDRQLAAA